jgi:7-carboxy-7-deazaguanine synthase
MRIFEILRTIQGESSRAGVPMDFIRLAGCDLACAYCDTPAAREMAAGRDMTVDEVLAALPMPALPWVEITGGEPALQAEAVNTLADRLLASGRGVLIETSGAYPLEALDARAVRIMDVKTPGSGMADRFLWSNLAALTPRDEVKFVLTGRADYEWARDVIRRHGLADKAAVLLGPARPILALKTLASWILEDALPVRLNLQIHKDLGLP